MMKFEVVDTVVVVLALLVLGSYIKFHASAFIYVFAVLVIAEIFVQIRFKREKHEVKEPESMS